MNDSQAEQGVERARILIVDDSPENLDILMFTLGDDNAVVAARSGEKALQLARSRPPDLILLDIMMPGMDGYEVLRQLREQPETRDIPVIFLTAMVGEEDELMGLNQGAVDYIRKPISPPLLLQRVATQLELVRSRKQLAAQVAELSAAAQLRSDVENISRHDMKGPLSPILSYPSLLLSNKSLSEDEREMLHAIRRAGQRLLDMINGSLDLYKLETGSYQLRADPREVAPILDEICKDMEFTMQLKQLKLEKELEDVWAMAEIRLTHTVFSNLIKNAIEASPRGGAIRISLKVEGDWAVTRIANAGVVPEQIRERFFEKYVTSAKNQGTGLGTYSARVMTRAMKGEIEMESSDASGTQLTVKLPVAKLPSVEFSR